MVNYEIGQRITAPVALLARTKELSDEQLVFDCWQDVLLELGQAQLILPLLLFDLLSRDSEEHAIGLIRGLPSGFVLVKACLRLNEALHGWLEQGSVPVEALTEPLCLLWWH